MKKFLKKSVKSLAILFLVAVFTFSNFGSYFFVNIGLPEMADNLEIQKAQAAAEGDGIIVYGKSGTAAPQYRLYDKLNNTWSAEMPVGGATFANTPYFITVKTAPTREEAVVGTLDNTGVLYIVRWNGASWAQLGSNIVTGLGTTKVFDIVYENISGDAIVVVGGAVDSSYYIWNGSTWSGPTTITQATKTTGVIRWVELTSRKTASSDEIALVYADANGDLNALIWSGLVWTEQTAVVGALSTGIENNAAATTMRAFDVEYETLSGDLIITWGNNATVDPRYVTRTAADVWSGVLTASTFVEIPSIMNIAAEPWGDRIAVGLQNDTKANNNDGDCGIWNGASWVNTVNCDINRDSQEAGDIVLGSGWVRSGADTRAINFYSDIADITLDYNYWVPGTGWTASQAFTPSPNCISASSDDNSFVVETNPFDETQMMIVRQAGTAICTQKTAYAGANAFNFGNAGNGSSLAVPSVSQYQPVGFAYFRFVVSPANTLTIGVTAGSKVTTVNSGDNSVYANTTSCSGPASCSAFTLNVSNTSVTVSSIKITETGIANATADLSQLALFYDTDGNYSNGVTGQYGATVASFTSESATVSGSLALTPVTTYYFYARFNASSITPTYPKGGQTINFQIAVNGDVTLSSGLATISGAPQTMAGTTTILPKVSSVSYGFGLSDGARSSEAITVSGYGFGVAPGGSRANCAGAVDTGCVRFLVGGATTVEDANISSWSNTSIGWTVSSALATLGGASSLEVVSGSQGTATDATYYVYPLIVSLTNCDKTGFPAGDFAREYDNSDFTCPNGLTDGAIVINGDHFGSAGSVTILSVTSIQSAVAGFCGGSAYSDTCITVQASSSIADNSYTGNVAVTRSADSKSDTRSGFRILPRITGFSPTGAPASDTVTLIGNHFCQAGVASCPTVFDVNNKITFYNGVDAIVFTSWSNISATTTVPNGAATGDVVLKSNSYDSNGKNFNVYSNTPSDPTNLNQYRNSALTQIITTSSPMVSSTPIYLTITMEVPGISGGTLYPQIEYKAVGTSFACGVGACASAVEGNGKAGPGAWDCSVTANNCAISISLADNFYHWQARVRHNKGGSDYYSNWISFGGNLENETDFQIDANAPTIFNVQSSNVDTNSATIIWDTNEGATSRAQYNKTGSFGVCSGDCTTLDLSYVTSHIVNLSNLDSGALYYYRVRSKDIAGNESISSNYTFTTGSVTQPAKTTKFYVWDKIDTINGGTTASTTFSVVMSENVTSTKSAFVEIRGIYDTTGSSPNRIGIQVNSQAAKYYEIPLVLSKSYFKIVYEINPINIDPFANIIYIIPESNTTIYISSVDIYVTYAYTP